jgi:HAD superfamily hydrolase (TIGR01484 family)
MIAFFVLDLDGCLTYPFETPDWKSVSKIREYQLQSGEDETIPALSLCTGRPLPYAEAVAQWMGIRDTIIFESGGGFFHPLTNELTWSPHFTDEIALKSREIRSWFARDVLSQFPGMMLEFTKHTDVGMVHTDIDEIARVYEIARKRVEADYPEFEVHQTGVSVNIIVKACNKASGLQFFADRHEVTASEIAYIGDSTGDLMALGWAGAPFAPSNAIPEVRGQARVMKGEATAGVLEAYEAIIAENRGMNS